MLLFKTYLFFTQRKYQTTVQNNKLKIIVPTWNDEFELIAQWFLFSFKYSKLF